MINRISKYIEALRIVRLKRHLGKCGKGVKLFAPYHIAGNQLIEIEEYARIMPNPTILAFGCKFIVKKYAVISYNLMVVTSNHCPTVGIPFSFCDTLHINETFRGDVIVGEESWLGANVTLLPGAKLSRGCVVGANTIINKEYPPYSVIVGNPARIIGTRFTKEQIIKHESIVYSKTERLSLETLDLLFEHEYKNIKRTIGVDLLNDSDRNRFAALVSEMGAELTTNW